MELKLEFMCVTYGYYNGEMLANGYYIKKNNVVMHISNLN